MTKKIKRFAAIVLSLAILLASGLFVIQPPVQAATCTGPVSENSNCGAGSPASGQKTAESLNQVGNDCANQSAANCLKNNTLVSYLNTAVDILSAGVGVVVVGVIILGGIQYSLSGDNATAVTAAKKRITNGLIALVAYALIFSFLQWIIPGGVFNNP